MFVKICLGKNTELNSAKRNFGLSKNGWLTYCWMQIYIEMWPPMGACVWKKKGKGRKKDRERERNL